MYNHPLIRFEIPSFGLVKFRPDVFQNLYAENDHKSIDEIVSELAETGTSGFVEHATREEVANISFIEWIAIYGECHGKGEA